MNKYGTANEKRDLNNRFNCLFPLFVWFPCIFCLLCIVTIGLAEKYLQAN